MTSTNCFHCGLKCPDHSITSLDHYFCCNGCKTVFEILNANELACYYDFETSPGSIPTEINGKYDFLDNVEISDRLLEFHDASTSVVELYIPVIHCSSCIWVLENLHKLNGGIIHSMVNFPKKIVRITFKNEAVGLRQLVELLASIGYEPYISLDDSGKEKKTADKTLVYQIGIAAFAFGNIMLLSFPEYFGVQDMWLERYKQLFRWIMWIMAVPVVFYSARYYFISAFKGLRRKILNIDVPIALGISVLFLRSTVEIVFDLGSGFLDSLTGLVLFLLLGKFFQQKTYSFLSFERDYRSYFPIAVTCLLEGEEQSKPVEDVEPGDRLLIRNEELIPVDGILISNGAAIDYSFVTGESAPVFKSSGDKLFAGGKQTSGPIEMEVVHAINQSYLTQLWSNDIFRDKRSISIKNITDNISRYFTRIVLGIALAAGIFWYLYDASMAINVVTAVLIIACPCALALSAPFALGNMLRIFGYRKFYVKNSDTLEMMARVDTVIFDKTGTITRNDLSRINYKGKAMNNAEKSAVKKVLRASNHPLSRLLFDHMAEVQSVPEEIRDFKEEPGKGLEARVGAHWIRLGSSTFAGSPDTMMNETAVHVSIDGQAKGYFTFVNTYRPGMKEVFAELAENYNLAVLSGDNDGEYNYLKDMLPESTSFAFNQKPDEKLAYVKQLQQEGRNVMMIGDGLNDAGALAQSHVGIAVSEDVNIFSPACDVIMDAKLFNKLTKFLTIGKRTIGVIKASFVLSFLYNIIGMYFALTGQLTPVVAAILMPLSSITIVVFVTSLTNLISRDLNH
jgi:Cu+-exporting ATPase